MCFWLRTFISLLFIVFVFNQHVHADDNHSREEVVILPEVIVTAPAIIEGNNVNRLGSLVTLVTKEQISNLNAQDLTSALRRVPGVVISRHNPVGSFGGGEGGALFIRGKGSSRPGAEIQTLIDGIPKFVSVWTHPLMDVLNVDIVETVDVYKGAQPILFGNMAFGAVDIHTKRMRDEGFETTLQVAYGSHNTLTGSVEHGGKVNGFDYYLLGGDRSSDGHRENADGELRDLFFRLGYEFPKGWDVNLTFIHTKNWADDPGPADGSFPSDGRFNTMDYFTVATISHSYNRGNGYFKLYRDMGDIDWVDQEETQGLDTLTNYQNYGLRVRETLNLWEGGEILLGVDLDYISGEVEFRDPLAADKKFPEETFRISSPYAALSHQFGTKEGFYAIPSAGVRYMDHNNFNNETGPQAGLTLGYKTTEIHASYSRGINYPGIYARVQDEVFMPGDNQWSDIVAEKLDHFEVGISRTFNQLEKIDLTWFYDDGKDRIVVSPPPPFPPVLTNMGEYRLRGIEGSVTLAPISELTIFAGFTYLDSEPGDLPYSPEWTYSSGINYLFFDDLQISFDALYVDEQYVTSRTRTEGTVNIDRVDSYFLLSGKIGYDFMITERNLKCQVYVAGENLTDAEYEQKKGYPMQGMSGMIGIVVKF
ncbi:TonB-dependent receptor plug domain-containing protein [Deltaproteobacteria bacterium]|nr:TonB-dependent receptor plug domain-containing protein [Deltaproteobacteria bacterium]